MQRWVRPWILILVAADERRLAWQKKGFGASFQVALKSLARRESEMMTLGRPFSFT